MSHRDGPPPIVEGDDFPYWKIRMEAYLEALDVGVLRATSEGFPKPKDPAHLQGDKVNYEKWNHKDTHALWLDIYALHEGTKSEHEEHYHLL